MLKKNYIHELLTHCENRACLAEHKADILAGIQERNTDDILTMKCTWLQTDLHFF